MRKGGKERGRDLPDQCHTASYALAVSFAKTDEPIEMPFGGRLPTRYPIDDVMTLESHSPTDNR